MRVIALDGPAGAGKSTISRLIAQKAGLDFLDTGAMYRAVAFAVLERGVDVNDVEAVGDLAEGVRIDLGDERLVVDGKDATDAIRGPQVTSVVSVIATYPRVRTAMREQQRQWIVAHGGGVVEGRDIGTVVFPDALLKVFVTASPRVRAERRFAQTGGDIDAIAESIAQRDHIDSTREDSPLRPAADSVVLDTSDMTIDEVVDFVVRTFCDRDVAGSAVAD